MPHLNLGSTGSEPDPGSFREIVEGLCGAQSPLLVIGRGATEANPIKLRSVLEHLGIPFVQTWGAVNLDLRHQKLNFGRIGVSGQRAANLIAGSADMVLILGARLAQAVTGPTLYHLFAETAQICVVECDPAEAALLTSTYPVQVLTTHVEDFVDAVLLNRNWPEPRVPRPWFDYCCEVRNKYQKEIRSPSQNGVDQYLFVEKLDHSLSPNDTLVVDGGGTIFYTAMQIFGQKAQCPIVIPTATAPMGSGLPQAIGAARARPQGSVVVLCGDGSLPFNMQELSVIRGNNLRVKVFVFDNSGYLSIRETQSQFLGGSMLGSTPENGLSLPVSAKIAIAFDLPYYSLDREACAEATISDILSAQGPCLCAVQVRPDQMVAPRLGFVSNAAGTFEPMKLSKMFPFLENDNMG